MEQQITIRERRAGGPKVKTPEIASPESSPKDASPDTSGSPWAHPTYAEVAASPAPSAAAPAAAPAAASSGLDDPFPPFSPLEHQVWPTRTQRVGTAPVRLKRFKVRRDQRYPPPTRRQLNHELFAKRPERGHFYAVPEGSPGRSADIGRIPELADAKPSPRKTPDPKKQRLIELHFY